MIEVCSCETEVDRDSLDVKGWFFRKLGSCRRCLVGLDGEWVADFIPRRSIHKEGSNRGEPK